MLVIEDNVDAAESLREVLKLEDHTVGVAYSGADGIEAARAFRPEVILCDPAGSSRRTAGDRTPPGPAARLADATVAQLSPAARR